MLKGYRRTIGASFLGYITQAIMINFPPLLFYFFKDDFGISTSQVSFLIAFNFVTELIVDLIASRYAPKIGYRKLVILADLCAILGLFSMYFLPLVLPKVPYLALCFSMMLCGIGGGLMEVLISPIVEACPTKNKSGMMSLLHSFYCWGQFGVVLISTLLFLVFDVENWGILALLWTFVPFLDLFMFIGAPIYTLTAEGQEKKPRELVKSKMFWLFIIMMMCAGASELTMSQWASSFAEEALGVSKWLGDLLGPCLFALAMALTRVFFAKFGEKIKLERGLMISSVICIFSYLLAIFAPEGFEILSLIGCALCGVGCGLMWPGTFSIASRREPLGGVFMFGMFALAGDFGCLAGPFLGGQVSSIFGDNLKVGFIFTLIFPITMLVASLYLLLKKKSK